MTERETGFIGRYGRYIWGGAAALLLLVLLASFVLSGSSVSAAEQQAQEHAASLAASVVEEQLTPDLLTRDIDGTDYRDLTVRVQAGILSDERFELVRIWRLDGGLIYSTAQRDDVNGVVAGDDQWIQQALGGRTVSVLSSAGTYHEGLRRPNEELFQTFIPVSLSSETVDAVIEIDQRYGAIHNEAYRLWRPLQLVAILLLIGAGVMLARTFRGEPSYGDGGVERRQSPGRRMGDLSVRDAIDRADQAERRMHDTEKRVAELEAQLSRAPSTATAAAAVEEFDLKLRASEAEREELAGTVKRLQAELVESQAEVTLARQGSAGTRTETKRVNKLIADAESKAVAAERKAAAAEKKSQDAAKRASMNAERGLELEAQLREAQKQAADVQKLSGGVDQRVADADRRLADAERRADKRIAEAEGSTEKAVARAEEQAQKRIAEMEATARKRVAEAETQVQRMVAEAERAAQKQVAATDGNAQKAVAEARRNAEKLVAEAERRAADAERRAGDAETRADLAEARTADAEARATEAGEGMRRKESGDRKVSEELKQVEGQRDELMSRLDKLERSLAEAQVRAETAERDLAVKSLELNASVNATASADVLEERATRAERRLADSEERAADAQSQLADALGKLRELEEARAALEERRDEDPAPRIGLGVGTDPEARIAELENARRADVAELQKAHEAFANTQLELSNTTRKLREAEARVKEFERSGNAPGKVAKKKKGPAPARDADAAPVPAYVAAADDPQAWGEVDDPFGDTSEAFEMSEEAWSDPPAPVEEPGEEEPDEGLSLRARLARAAAARKRLS
jgi:chromosome segregation ATPase